MSDQWVVVLDTGGEPPIVYGPIDDGQEAFDFAEYLTAEVDPATVRKLRSPTRELPGSFVPTHPGKALL